MSCGHAAKLRLRKARVILAVFANIADICVSLLIVNNGYAKILDFLYISTLSRIVPSRV